MTISVIVAVSDNGVIGKDGKIPWKLSTDLARFNGITCGGAVIMGRKTFQTLSMPLDKRLNIVISNRLFDFAPDEIEIEGAPRIDHEYKCYVNPTGGGYWCVCRSVMDGIKLASARHWISAFRSDPDVKDDTFIIGGQQIYDEIFKTPELIHRVYLTRVHCNVEGDAFFHYLFYPSVLWPVGEKYIKWHLEESTFIPKSAKDEYDSTFQVWENRS